MTLMCMGTSNGQTLCVGVFSEPILYLERKQEGGQLDVTSQNILSRAVEIPGVYPLPCGARGVYSYIGPLAGGLRS